MGLLHSNSVAFVLKQLSASYCTFAGQGQCL